MTAEQIVIGGSDPLFDTVFDVADQRFARSNKGAAIYSATMTSQSHGGDTMSIGIDIILDGWQPRQSADFPIRLFDGDIRLRSTGEGTLRLAATWSSVLNKTSVKQAQTGGTAILEAVAFENDPAIMQAEGFSGKFWIDPSSGPECEVFLKIHPDRKQAWFGEKSDLEVRGFVDWLERLA